MTTNNITDLYATLEAVTKTAQEVKDLLQKSLPPPPAPMGKAEEDETVPPAAPVHAEPDADNAGGPSDQDADNVVPPAVEGQEGQEGGMEQFAQEISTMADEELETLLQALAAEMEKREAAKQPEAPATPPAINPEVEAMKTENIAMKKSLQVMQQEISVLKKSFSSRPASMNAQTVTVAEKSKKAPESLAKSEVVSHLESLKKSGNRSVDTDLIWSANAARSAEDLQEVYRLAKLKGIEIPFK